MQNKNTKAFYDVLVLFDFSEASYMALKYIVSMSKLTKCNIHICHIANSEETENSENDSIKSFEEEVKNIEIKLNSIIEVISIDGIHATSQCTSGNVISALKNQITLIQPSLVVIGKKEENASLSGKLTSYLINDYSGSLLLVEKESEFLQNTKISIGYHDKMLKRCDPSFVFELGNYTKSPLTLVTVKKPFINKERIEMPSEWQSYLVNKENCKCEIKKDSTIVNGLAEHVLHKNIELLCVGRGKQKSFVQNLFSSKTSIVSEIAKKINIPLLVIGENFETN